MSPFFKGSTIKFYPLVFLTIVSYAALSFIFFPESIDDAYITLRFAQNFLDGYGLIFNPLSDHVEGYSNLSWVLLLALCGKLGISMELAMKVLGFISGIFTLVLTYLSSRQIFSNEYFRFVPVLMLASSAFFALWAVDGLETVFYTMLLSLLLYFLNNNQHPLQLGLLLGVILLTRPEGVLFSVLAIGYVYYRNNLPYALKLATISGAIFLAQLIFRWSYYHELVANTALNKLQPGLHSILDGINYLLQFNQDSGYLILPLMLLGILNPRSTQKTRLMLLFILMQIIFLMVSGGDFMYGFRFIIPILPILCILATLGLQTLVSKKTTPLTKIVMIGFLIAWTAISEFQNLPQKTINIDNLTFRSSPHFLMGNYLKEHANPNDLILLSEAGIIPYYSKLATRDYLGLVSAYKTIYDSTHHLNVYNLLAERPRYIILSFWKDYDRVEHPRMEPEIAILGYPDFQKNYRVIKEFAMNRNDSFLNAMYYKYWSNASEIYFRIYELNRNA